MIRGKRLLPKASWCSPNDARSTVVFSVAAALLVVATTVFLSRSAAATPSAETFDDTYANTVSSTNISSDGSPDRITWNGGEWYLHGANLPWYNWGCDFGCGRSGGVLQSAAVIGNRLAGDFNNVRWWVFPGDDPWQLSNMSATYADFDRALELAEEHDVYYTFTLFSSPTAVDLNNPERVVQALTPLFQRYGDHPRILSWEVFNEPEFAVWSNEVSEAAIVAFTRQVVDAIHEHTASYATVGHAMLDGIAMWDSVDLDYHQPHWYDYMESGNWCALCTTAAELRSRYGTDKPIVIGEFYAGSEVDAEDYLQQFYDRGYAGAWAWSLFPERTDDGMRIDERAVARFVATHGDIGPTSNGGAPSEPSPTMTPTPTPTSTPSPTPSSTPTPTATPTPPVGGDELVWSTSARAGQRVVRPGSSISVEARVGADGPARALIDLEVYGPTGEKVSQEWWDNREFAAGHPRSFTKQLTLPKNARRGTYTVKIGIFGPN